MPSAAITINGSPGSNDNLPINTLVLLNNSNSGGETTYLWAIVNQPVGATDSLSATNIRNPSFTPKKEGTYLIRLVVNQGLPTEVSDQAIVGILQVDSEQRIPAAGETLENSTTLGWATAVTPFLQYLDAFQAAPLRIVGQLSGVGVTRGTVCSITDSATILAGLPGERIVPVLELTDATIWPAVNSQLYVLVGGVDGDTTPADGALCYFQMAGLFGTVPSAGAVGDNVYLQDDGSMDTTVGTIRRVMGKVAVATGAEITINLGPGPLDSQPEFVQVSIDTDLVLTDSVVGVSPAAHSSFRSNAGKMQVSENGGAWTNILATGGNAPAGAAYLISGPNAALPSAIDVTHLAPNLILTGYGATNNDTQPILTVRRLVNGGAAGAIGVGAGINFYAANATGAATFAGGMIATFTAVGAGNEDSDLQFFNIAAGTPAGPVMSLTSAGVMLVAAAAPVGAEIARFGGKVRVDGDPTAAQDAVTLAYLQAHAFSILTWGALGTPALGGGSVSWLYPGGGSATSDPTNQIGWEAPVAGTLSLMRYSSVTGPTTGAGNPVEEYTLYVNGVASTLTIAVNAGVTSASDLVHTVTLAAGNRVSMRVISNAGATASSVYPMISMKFSPA